MRHDRTEILSHQIGMLLHGFGKRAEDHPRLGQGFLEGRRHGNAVKNRIDSHAGQHFLFFEGNAEFFIGRQKFGIDLVQTLRAVARILGRGVVHDALIVDIRIRHHRPLLGLFALERVGHGQPVAIGFQAPCEQPIGLVFFRGDKLNDVFIQAWGSGFLLDIRHPAKFVIARRQRFELLGLGTHGKTPFERVNTTANLP